MKDSKLIRLSLDTAARFDKLKAGQTAEQLVVQLLDAWEQGSSGVSGFSNEIKKLESRMMSMRDTLEESSEVALGVLTGLDDKVDRLLAAPQQPQQQRPQNPYQNPPTADMLNEGYPRDKVRQMYEDELVDIIEDFDDWELLPYMFTKRGDTYGYNYFGQWVAIAKDIPKKEEEE